MMGASSEDMDDRAHLLVDDNSSDTQVAAPESVSNEVDFPEHVVTAPASPAFLLGHDEEAQTLVTSRASLFAEMDKVSPDDTIRGDRRAVQKMLQAAKRDEEGSYPLVLPKVPKPSKPQPPALPISLVRKKEDWIEELPVAARRVLEDARELHPSWPLRQRVEGSVAMPRQKIPSLGCSVVKKIPSLGSVAKKLPARSVAKKLPSLRA